MLSFSLHNYQSWAVREYTLLCRCVANCRALEDLRLALRYDSSWVIVSNLLEHMRATPTLSHLQLDGRSYDNVRPPLDSSFQDGATQRLRDFFRLRNEANNVLELQFTVFEAPLCPNDSLVAFLQSNIDVESLTVVLSPFLRYILNTSVLLFALCIDFGSGDLLSC
jgi:hypothetical protein